MKCIHCGASLRPTAKLCIQCGNTVTAEAPPPPAVRSSTVAVEPTVATVSFQPEPTAAAPEAPKAALTASAEPMAPAVEVAPEFAAPAPAARHEPVAGATTKGGQSGQKLVLVGLAVLVVAAGAGYALNSRSDKTATPTAPESAPTPAPVTPPVALTATPAQRPLDRAVLNQMLQLVAENKWTELVALTQVLAPAGAGQPPEALREQAQASLDKQQPEQAQQAVLEALLRDPQSGASWLMAARVFAERDASGPAESALRLAYYFAKDRQQAIASLTDMAKGAELKFKAVVNSQLPELYKIPPR